MKRVNQANEKIIILILLIIISTNTIFAQQTEWSGYLNIIQVAGVNINQHAVESKYKTRAKIKKSSIIEEIAITFYPNPTRDNLYINSSKPVNTIIIYDRNGQETMRTKPVNNQISIAHLKKGFYLVSVEIEGAFTKKKIIKKK